MSDYTANYTPANPGTDYPAKIGAMLAKLTLDSDRVDTSQLGYQFGERRNAHAGLDYAYYGGVLNVDGALSTIADGTVTLTNAATNYVERTHAGAVSKNTVGFSADKVPMAEVTTAGGAITAVVDRRGSNPPAVGLAIVSIAGGAGTQVLTIEQARAEIIIFTGAKTGNRAIEFPNVKRSWIIGNDSTGAFTVTAKVTGQPGVVITQDKRVVVYGTGADIAKAQTEDSAGVAFPSGTRMLFQQTSAPTGWTKDTGAGFSDRAIRCVTGTVGIGGSQGFSTVFGVGKNTGNYTLATADIPAHGHNWNGNNNLAASGDGAPTLYTVTHTMTTANAGGGGAHAHSIPNVDLVYFDVIVAQKD